MTVREEFGTWEGKVVTWIGDGNNVANSWLNSAGVLGFELRLACPEGFEPNHDIYERADGVTTVSIHDDPEEAIEGAHVVNTDVWASMGQEGEADARKLAFKGYTVDENMMKLAAPDAIFLHCLPAHRGEEVTEEVIEGSQSRVFNQAENRLHAQKALMAILMGGESA
jgi:ornithine carbamoyltransferase